MSVSEIQHTNKQTSSPSIKKTRKPLVQSILFARRDVRIPLRRQKRAFKRTWQDAEGRPDLFREKRVYYRALAGSRLSLPEKRYLRESNS